MLVEGRLSSLTIVNIAKKIEIVIKKIYKALATR